MRSPGRRPHAAQKGFGSMGWLDANDYASMESGARDRIRDLGDAMDRARARPSTLCRALARLRGASSGRPSVSIATGRPWPDPATVPERSP
jgi:hypothetical protein